ncbi:DUF2231 domain-containing protein [Microbacterium sp. NPDC079995]|uniref:DUF2231 domain-containing protein n=1 Tax=unclassified Microbacterium TaxID=2609290 RepID=UPI00344D9EDB
MTVRLPAAEALRRAKRPRSPLAGPYGHPFHATAVTIPIGAWTAALVFDLISFFVDDPEPFVIGARVLLIIGIAGAAAASVLGFLDFLTLERGTDARRTALAHVGFNLAALVLFVVSAVLRFGTPDDINVAAFVIALVAFAGIGVSGWLGGELAYRHGVRVADESTQIDAFR